MNLPDPTAWPVGNVGYVAVVGRPNVGKSTFLNQALGAHLLAVSAMPQTTRKHWRGILSDERSQIVFIDTPGAHRGKTRLNDHMLDAVDLSLQDADIVLCMADPTREGGEEDQLVAERVAACSKPVLLLINKCDEAPAEAQDAAIAFFEERLVKPAKIFRLSALKGEGVAAVITYLRKTLPKGPFFFPPDQTMDAFERDIGSEIIREAALGLLHDEVPHALAVEILQWQEAGKRLKIDANLHVERETQKGIVVGKGGAMINEIRRQAERSLKLWLERHIALRLHVKVAKDWRNRDGFMREHGLVDRAE